MSLSAAVLTAYTPRAELIELFDGDAEFVGELATEFAAHCPVALQDIHEALQAGDPARVSRAAHAFKGTIGYFDVDSQALVETIERNPSAEMARLPSLVAALEARIGRLTEHLRMEF